MNATPIAAPVRPALRDVLDGFKREVLQSMNCHLFGTIVSIKIEPEFVPRVSVQIASKKVLPDGSVVDYPLLTDCPVFVLSGGDAFIQMPIKAGDSCLVLFHDTDMDNWWVSGNSTAPNSPRSHSLSDGMVLVGFPNMARPLAGNSPSAITLVNKAVSITIDPSSGISFIIGGGSGTSFIQAQPDGTITFHSDAGAVIVLSPAGKINVSNGTTSLHTALDALCDVLSLWVNTGGSTPNPATVTAIAVVKTTLDSLLY